MTLTQMLDRLIADMPLIDAATLGARAGCTRATAEEHLRDLHRRGLVGRHVHPGGRVTWVNESIAPKRRKGKKGKFLP